MTKLNRKRNTPCECGSGKKFKDCCRGSKPRNSYVLAVSKPIGEIFPNIFPSGILPAAKWQIELSPNGVQINIDGKNINTNMSIINSVHREKGDKILRKLPTKSINLNDISDISAIHKYYTQYDFIFAIDTNTIQILGVNHSVSICIISQAILQNDSVRFNYKYYETIYHQDISTTEVEKRGIVHLINSIKNNVGYDSNQYIGIVTDTALGSHHRINSGDAELYDGLKLPSNFRLIYASSDGGAENPLNQLIRLCDKESSRILNEKRAQAENEVI